MQLPRFKNPNLHLSLRTSDLSQVITVLVGAHALHFTIACASPYCPLPRMPSLLSAIPLILLCLKV